MLYIEETVRALSWKQPFASLMLCGKIETRNRPTKVRGKVLICSTQKRYNETELNGLVGGYNTVIGSRLRSLIRGRLTGIRHRTLEGYALAMADLVDCRPMTKADEYLCFVAYKPGLWCWIFDNVQEIEPFPIKGAQGWKLLDEETKSKIVVRR